MEHLLSGAGVRVTAQRDRVDALKLVEASFTFTPRGLTEPARLRVQCSVLKVKQCVTEFFSTLMGAGVGWRL